jgi:hypothetical protein
MLLHIRVSAGCRAFTGKAPSVQAKSLFPLLGRRCRKISSAGRDQASCVSPVLRSGVVEASLSRQKIPNTAKTVDRTPVFEAATVKLTNNGNVDLVLRMSPVPNSE